MAQPKNECVTVRWPKFRSSGFEMKKNILPMIELGKSMSGASEPIMATVKITQ